MARYNSVSALGTTSSAGTISTPSQGLFTTLTGSPPYTVTISSPVLYSGVSQSFWNNTGGVVTLSTPSGNFTGKAGSAASTLAMPAGANVDLTADGTNWVVTNYVGGPGYFSSVTATGAVTLSPASGNVAISPTGTVTINPSSASPVDNVNIGANTRGTGAFTTLAANGALTLTAGANNSSLTTTGAGVLTISSGTLGSINNMSIGGTTAAAGSFTTLTVSSTLSGSGFTTLFTSPPGAIGSGTAVAGTFTTLTATTITETSSITLKENVSPIDNALDKVLQLFGVTYDRKDGSSKNEAGLIAEDVYKIVPELVTLDENGKPMGIKYTKLGAYLIESIKSLKAELDEIKGSK